MFKNAIMDTPLNSGFANTYFEKINGEYFGQGDISFIATLRALLCPRISEDDSVYLSFHSSRYSAGDIRGTARSALIDAICDRDMRRYRRSGRIYIHSFNSASDEDNEANLKNIEENFEYACEGWHRIEKVTTFYRKSFYVLCYINPELKSVYLFTENLDYRKLHYLQCSIFAFMPWYFDPKDGVSEDEMELINSLREKDSAHYERCIAKIAEKSNLRELSIRKLLDGFETRYERIEADKARNRIAQYNEEIVNLNERIGDYLREIREMNIRLLGLTTKMEQSSDDSEIMEYFLCNKNVSLREVTDSAMTFVCGDYLEYFDEDMARHVIDNSGSYVYRPGGRSANYAIRKENMKKLMYAIFVDGTLKMKMCAAYRLELDGSVRAMSGYEYGAEFSDCTPNTHIDRYSCMGNYNYTINQMLKDHNYIGAVEQCIASCKSLNFGDSCVMEEFMRRLYGMSDYDVNIRCIELPDKSIVEPKEAIEWLLKQEAGNE